MCSSSVKMRWSISLVTVVLGIHRWTSFISLQWLTPHFVHSERTTASSIITRSIWLVIVRSSGLWTWTFIVEVPHLMRRTTFELPFSERNLVGISVRHSIRHSIRHSLWVSHHWTSTFGTMVIIEETIMVRSMYHFVVATYPGFLIIRLKVFGVLRTLVEMSSVVISIAVIVSSWSRSSPFFIVLILRRKSPSVIRM